MAAEPKPDDPADKRTPFERFEHLTRRLVSVPKAEVDALRNKREKSRKTKR